MSDRDDLRRVDLESAFEHLVTDVDAHTRARGAERAFRVAGRRRLTASGGVLAVAAVLVAVLIGMLGLPGHDSAPTVAAPSSDQLPAPRPFDATAFDEAAEGWISGWAEGSSPVPTEMPCVPYDGELPEPLVTSTAEFRAGTSVGATYKVERFDTAERAGDSFLRQTYGESCQGELSEFPDEIWSGGQSVAYAVTSGRLTHYEILVVHETGLAVLQIAGPNTLPEDVRQRVVLALLASLRT